MNKKRKESLLFKLKKIHHKYKNNLYLGVSGSRLSSLVLGILIGSRPDRQKKIVRPHFNRAKKKLGVVIHTFQQGKHIRGGSLTRPAWPLSKTLSSNMRQKS
jgi:hypothetical protein